MYGCRRSPNRKLNHTNLICGRANQITCFGCSADEEFIFVTKLSWRRKRGAGETGCTRGTVSRGILQSVGWGGGHRGSVSVRRGDWSCQDLQNTNNKVVFFLSLFLTAVSELTNVSSLQGLRLPCGGFWLRGLKESISRVWVIFFYIHIF